MRATIARAVIAIAGAATTFPALAGTSANQSAPQPSLSPYVVVDLMTRKLAPNQDPIEQRWVEQLIGYYAAANAQTIWTDADGMRPSAGVAIGELRQADDYALDPSRLGISAAVNGSRDLRSLAAFEVKLSLAVARYAFHARGGRYQPAQLSLWLDYAPKPPNAVEILKSILSADDAAAGLRNLHPQHAQFEALRKAYLSERGGTATNGAYQVNIPMGVRIKPGRRHPDVAQARLRLGKPAPDGDNELLDSDFQDALHDFMNNVARHHYGRGRGIDDDVRIALNGGSRGGNRATMDLLRVNMERWRWLPREFGDLYVWNNLPEFETRVVKKGEIIHRERIIIGQPSTQTPVFSDSMLRVIFKPDWNVPESIKLSSIWGNLRGGDYGVLSRRNMRIVHEGRVIDPAKLKYAELNARDVPIVMGPGSDNPLGNFKFVFPNKHDVYMHDTTSKGLFESKERTFSHGCIRVRDPQRFAEVVLGEAKGWNAADVRWQTRVKSTSRIELDRQIPVHNTYFTLVADASGTLKKLTDVYGHDKRMIDAFNGVDVAKIASADPALAQKKKNEALASGALVVAQPVKRAPTRAVAVIRKPPPLASSVFRPAPSFGQPLYLGRRPAPRAVRYRPPPRARGLFFFW